jgi:DNA repair protein RecO (recombination protein O)
MSREIKLQAMVIKKTDYSEADRIVKILSEEYGKLDVIVKGIKKSKRRDKTAVDVFTLTEFVINYTNNRVIAKSFETINPFIKLRMDLFKMNAAYYVLTTLDQIEIENSTQKKIARLTFNSIDYINREENKHNVVLLLVYFIYKIIIYEGLNFEILEGRVFNIAKGRIDDTKDKNCVQLTEDEKTYFLLLNSVDIGGINKLKSKENIHYKVLGILEKYLNYHMSTNINITRLIGRNYLDEFS